MTAELLEAIEHAVAGRWDQAHEHDEPRAELRAIRNAASGTIR